MGANPPKTGFKWLIEGEKWCLVDKLGREYPCCEFMFEKRGFTDKLD